MYTKHAGMGYKNAFLIKVKIVSSELNKAYRKSSHCVPVYINENREGASCFLTQRAIIFFSLVTQGQLIENRFFNSN